MTNPEIPRVSQLELATTDPVITTSEAGPVVDCFGLTDLGRSRTKNEDAFLIGSLERALVVKSSSLPVSLQPQLSTGAGGSLFVVADGMGGMGGGDVASRVAIATVADYLISHMPLPEQREPGGSPTRGSLPEIRRRLDSAIHAGDEQVKSVGQRGVHPHMGTTLTMAYVLWPRLYVAHVGDSRCYVFREGKLWRLTRDHNFAEQAAGMGFKPVNAESAVGAALWNALGADTDTTPDITRHELARGDQLLLCSDGLNRHLPDESLARLLSYGWSAERLCREMVDTANVAGGCDNITVVVARF